MDTSSNQGMDEGRIKAVIESAVDGIDKAGIVTMYSPSCETLFG